jgi:hypothetical protein
VKDWAALQLHHSTRLVVLRHQQRPVQLVVVRRQVV